MKLLYHSKYQEYGDIWTYSFEPVEPLTWIPGQSIRIELPAGYGTEERRFTIASAPFENVVRITTRISQSDFKQALAALEPAQQIDAFNIEGDFIWKQTAMRRILCASGVGITAYVPILKQLIHDHTAIPATLLYANHDEHFIYAELIETAAALHPEFKTVHLPGTRLNAALVMEHCPDFANSLVYLSGPSTMVDQVGTGLRQAGVPESNIIEDWFTGRPGWDEV